MGNIGMTEIIFIAVLVTFLFGPKQLPDLLRKIRSFMKDFYDFRRESERTVRDIEAEVLKLEDDKKDGGASLDK